MILGLFLGVGFVLCLDCVTGGFTFVFSWDVFFLLIARPILL
jgi:hypothetical protein